MNVSVEVSVDDLKMIFAVEEISKKGNRAEVKRNRKGGWIIYEVEKKRKRLAEQAASSDWEGSDDDLTLIIRLPIFPENLSHRGVTNMCKLGNQLI